MWYDMIWYESTLTKGLSYPDTQLLKCPIYYSYIVPGLALLANFNELGVFGICFFFISFSETMNINKGLKNKSKEMERRHQISVLPCNWKDMRLHYFAVLLDPPTQCHPVLQIVLPYCTDYQHYATVLFRLQTLCPCFTGYVSLLCRLPTLCHTVLQAILPYCTSYPYYATLFYRLCLPVV